jgi:hypothetical protein
MVATCRHGKGEAEGQLSVPGVAEADDQTGAMDALMMFGLWLKSKRVPRGVRICPKVV